MCEIINACPPLLGRNSNHNFYYTCPVGVNELGMYVLGGGKPLLAMVL